MLTKLWVELPPAPEAGEPNDVVESMMGLPHTPDVRARVLRTDDTVPSPNSVLEIGGDGIRVLRASTARVIGNTITGNQRSGLSVQQASHADVAGNTFNGNDEHAIRVIGNSVVNLADSAMGLFTQPNKTTVPNGLFGIRCESGAYLDGPLGSLVGKNGPKDVSDSTCIDRSVR